MMDLSSFPSLNFLIVVVTLLIIIPKLYPLLFPRPIDRWTGKPLSFLHHLLTSNFLSFAKYWNQYEIHGDEYLTKNCLLVGFHTRSTFDNLYILASLRPKFIASYFLFHIPFASTLFRWYGAIPSKGLNSSTTDDEFLSTLLDGDIPVLVLPGGSYEAYKPYEERYQVNWKTEPGFARLLVNHSKENPKVFETKIIPFYTRNGDEILFNHPWWYTHSSIHARRALVDIRHGKYLSLFTLMFYGGLGLGFLPFPRPIKLDTFYGKPLRLKKNETSIQFGQRIQNSLQELINKVNNDHNKLLSSSSSTSSSVSFLELQKKKRINKKKKLSFLSSILERVYGILYGTYMFLQNLCFAIFGCVTTMLAVPAFLISGILNNYQSGKKKEKKNDKKTKDHKSGDHHNNKQRKRTKESDGHGEDEDESNTDDRNREKVRGD